MSLGSAAMYPEVVGSQSPFSPVSYGVLDSLTRWIAPRNQGERQTLDLRVLVGRKRFTEFVGGCDSVLNHIDHVLNVVADFEKRISVGR